MQYMPVMDGLRAIAVIAVVHHHWFKSELPFASWGVILFFVISGYLITKSIDQLRSTPIGLFDAAKEFFAKRSLRLFPAYYVCVAYGLLTSEYVREHAFYFLTYTSNVLIWQRDTWTAPWGTPTWSLAVEEQFYLLWFFCAFVLRSRALLALICLLFVSAPIARWLNVADGVGVNTLLIMQTDGLVAGAALYFSERAGIRRRITYWVPFLAFLVCLLLAFRFGGQPWHQALGGSLFLVAAAAIVWNSRLQSANVFEHVLASRLMTYFGRISYGIYLYHIISPALMQQLQRVVPSLWRIGQQGSIDGFVAHVLLTIALAAASYHLLERPIRNLYRGGVNKAALV